MLALSQAWAAFVGPLVSLIWDTDLWNYKDRSHKWGKGGLPKAASVKVVKKIQNMNGHPLVNQENKDKIRTEKSENMLDKVGCGLSLIFWCKWPKNLESLFSVFLGCFAFEWHKDI